MQIRFVIHIICCYVFFCSNKHKNKTEILIKKAERDRMEKKCVNEKKPWSEKMRIMPTSVISRCVCVFVWILNTVGFYAYISAPCLFVYCSATV